MLQPAVLPHAVETCTASVHSGSTVLTTDAERHHMQNLMTTSQSTMLGPWLDKSCERSAVPTCTHCPTCLGNPASILPFLTAQANSVFSMASGNEASLPSGGGILASSSSTQTRGDNERAAVSTESDMPVDLDLGSGWKVVGLTSLSDLPSQVSTQAQQAPVMTTNVFGGEMLPSTTVELNSSRQNGSDLSASGDVMSTASVPGEWKVVGLTSLKPGDTEISCKKEATVSAQNVDASGGKSGNVNLHWNRSLSTQNQSPELADLRKTTQSDFHLPSLADLAAGTSEWKIAGITTLKMPVGSPVAPSGPVDTASPQDDLADVPVTTAADLAKWKVVGVTSLNSQAPNPSSVMSSSLTPIPVVMASNTPLVSVPTPPTSGDGQVEWKVVGVVPLPHSGEALSDKLGSQVGGSTEEPECKVQNNCLASGLQHHDDSMKEFTNSRARMHETQASSMFVQNRKWAPSQMFKSREDSSHPLAFLKNCSNQFKNAVLKKNTVSTMLELKRAFRGTDPEDKFVTFLGGRNVYSVNKQDDLNTFCGPSHASEYMNQDVKVNEPMHLGTPPAFTPSHGIGQSAATYDFLPQSNKLLSPNQSTESLETDDKVALSNAYRSHSEAIADDTAPANNAYFSLAQSYLSSQGNAHSAVPLEKNQTVCSAGYVKMIKSEDGQSVMTIPGFDSDSVNLSNVDPWGVCTDEDLGEIAEMISEKEDNRTFHTSSRKRKLTTPRKMVL